MNIEEFQSRLQGVKRSGDGFTAHCPAHEDRRSSLSFKAGDDGKVLVHCHAGCTTEDVCASLGIQKGDLFATKPKPEPKRRARIATTYDYTDEHGELVFQVVRMDPKGFRQRRPDPENPGKWIWNIQGIKRPLYNLPAVLSAIKAAKGVFLVEGEKDVESLRELVLTATTNAGGASKWDTSYTDILRQARIVAILPDNDEPGVMHAEKVHAQLPTNSVIVRLPGLPPKGDVSDWIAAGGSRDELMRLMRAAIKERDSAPPSPSPPTAALQNWTEPFRCLGYDGENLYILPSTTQQILVMTGSSLRVKPNLLRLAPLDWWETHYGGERGINWTTATDNIIRKCETGGLWSMDRCRGRGAWWEDGRVILHQGDSLVINGAVCGLDTTTRYVYQRAPRLAIPHTDAIPSDLGQQLVELCQMLPFERKDAAIFLAGWLALAPICGALLWRPHIWITGGAGSGKTWILTFVVGELLGPLAVRVQSVTTEAGLRQELSHDARPVVFDEMESDTTHSQIGMQRVLELARQASSESGGRIIKGTLSGQAAGFQIRSMFCMSSIGIGVRRQADETRVTVLSLRRVGCETQDERDEAGYRFKEIQRRALAVCTPEYSAGLIARSCRLAGVIRENAATFGAAIAAKSDARLGDQIGTLLAGHWSLWSDEAITLQEATGYIKGMALEDFTPPPESKDEDKCLSFILEATIRIDLQNPLRTVERPIGELVQATAGTSKEIGDVAANEHLRRYGLLGKPEGLYISNSHSLLGHMLNSTPWAGQWGQFLARLPGAQRKGPMRFGATVARSTLIPWALIEREPQEITISQEGEELF